MRHFFDILVERHAVVLNPFQSVRGIKYQVLDGKTPEITIAQARILVAAIDVTVPSGLRARAILGTMITTGCRIGALGRLRSLNFRKFREIPSNRPQRPISRASCCQRASIEDGHRLLGAWTRSREGPIPMGRATGTSA